MSTWSMNENRKETNTKMSFRSDISINFLFMFDEVISSNK